MLAKPGTLPATSNRAYNVVTLPRGCTLKVAVSSQGASQLIAYREGAMVASIWIVVAVLGLHGVAAEKGMNVAVDSHHIE